ncbi:hypothetical protein MLD38_015401 [Melastoma candidum]|uniref:Uncharacterized protein n=1 Tax=Melastoma candidum TaxID=119954 RepID=A0ACB9RH55_9MYRT|nr:hypothetical protein MLD38_015401 [Melastoma candidum]
MYKRERTTRDTPSFSSSLLNEIYRSIDEEVGADLTRDPRFRECLARERKGSKCDEWAGEVEVLDWRVSRGFDRHALLFGSMSSCSDSSSNGFSSSDSASMSGGANNRRSSVAPPRLKAVRSSMSLETGVKGDSALFHEHRKLPGLDGDEGIIRTKSRVPSFYSSLKKVKHPVSPGAKLASFINSIFTANINGRKPKLSATTEVKSGDSSACSSASSFTRSCLSKYSPKTREKLRDGAKRTVRFFPISVILDENSRPCAQKPLYLEGNGSARENATNRTIQDSCMDAHRKSVDKTRYNPPADRRSRGPGSAIEFLQNYRRNQNKVEKTAKVAGITTGSSKYQVGCDHDTESCTSSDLFELDHLELLSGDMYCEELPVYETTHIGTNCAIASGVIV